MVDETTTEDAIGTEGFLGVLEGDAVEVEVKAVEVRAEFVEAVGDALYEEEDGLVDSNGYGDGLAGFVGDKDIDVLGCLVGCVLDYGMCGSCEKKEEAIKKNLSGSFFLIVARERVM